MAVIANFYLVLVNNFLFFDWLYSCQGSVGKVGVTMGDTGSQKLKRNPIIYSSRSNS